MAEHLYRVYGLTLASLLPLPELAPSGAEAPTLRFRLAGPKESRPAFADITWRHQWTDAAGRNTQAVGVWDGAYVLDFPSEALFLLTQDGAEVCCHPDATCSPPLLRHLILDQVIPRVLAFRGELVAHAGAVLYQAACACFLGASGAGKSTLTAALGRSGGLSLADDGVVLRVVGDEPVCIPGYAGARLWPDSMGHLAPDQGSIISIDGAKRRILSDGCGAAPEAAPLAVLYILDDAEPQSGIRMTPLLGAEAVLALTRHSFLLDPGDQRQLACQFAGIGKVLTAGARVVRLSYPREYGALDAVCAAVKGAMGEGQGRC